jgi:hypothetical protein
MDNQQTAIIKATYTRARGVAKANIRYIQHRKGLGGHKATRELFGAEGALERLQAYQMIDTAEKGTVYFRIIISPPQLEESASWRNKDLAEITSQTMRHLAERIGKEVPYIAAAHAADHSPYHHVHCLALVHGRLNTQDFSALRQRATEAALGLGQERAQQQQQREGGGLERQR